MPNYRRRHPRETFQLGSVARGRTPGDQKRVLDLFAAAKEAEHVSSLPSLSEIFEGLAPNGQLRIIADNNVSRSTARYLRNSGFVVVAIKQTHDVHVSDEYIAEQALGVGAIIVTYDNDFKEFQRFDLANLPGIVILPYYAEGRKSPELDPCLRAALDHLAQSTPKTIEEWRATVVKYETNGQVTIYSLPSRPDESSKPISRVACYFSQLEC